MSEKPGEINNSKTLDAGKISVDNKKAYKVNFVSNINSFKKLTRTGTDQYEVTIDTKKYRFSGDGTVGILVAQKGVRSIKKIGNSAEFIKNIQKKQREINRVIEGSKQELGNIKLGVKSQSKSVESNKKLVSDQELFVGLQSLIGKGQRLINDHLDRNRDQYSRLFNSPIFQRQLEEARRDPKKGALILQLYAKFVLNDPKVVVDGIYGGQTKAIAKKYESIVEDQKKIQERDRRGESYRENGSRKELQPVTQEEKVTYTATKAVEKSIAPEDNVRYGKLFRLPEQTINSLISPREMKKRSPEWIEKNKEKRQSVLFEKAKKSAIKGCINYLQTLFKQTIKGTSEDLSKLFDQFDGDRDLNTHGQNLDFKVTLDGKPFTISYNILDGQINYTPIFDMETTKGDIRKGIAGVENIFIQNGLAPSLSSILANAKKEITGAASEKPGNRKGIKEVIKNIELPPLNLQREQEIIAKKVAKQSCIQTFVDVTGYVLPQDLSKQSYQNTQIYTLYDIMNRTLENPDTKADDIYKFKRLLLNFKDIVYGYGIGKYKNPADSRRKEFSAPNILEKRISLLSSKQGDARHKSLPFYSFLSQFIDDPRATPDKFNYRVISINKFEQAINQFKIKKIWPSDDGHFDKLWVASVEKKDREDAEKMINRA